MKKNIIIFLFCTIPAFFLAQDCSDLLKTDRFTKEETCSSIFLKNEYALEKTYVQIIITSWLHRGTGKRANHIKFNIDKGLSYRSNISSRAKVYFLFADESVAEVENMSPEQNGIGSIMLYFHPDNNNSKQLHSLRTKKLTAIRFSEVDYIYLDIDIPKELQEHFINCFKCFSD